MSCRGSRRFAFEGIEGLDTEIRGPVAIAFGYGDPAAGTKILLDFAKEGKDRRLPLLRQGLLEGEVLSADRLQAIADLPSREVLLQQLLGLMLAPHRALMGVINGPGRALATVIDAWYPDRPAVCAGPFYCQTQRCQPPSGWRYATRPGPSQTAR